MAKKKKLTKAERKEARLRKGKQWLLTYTGSPKKMNKHYRERFHVDAVTAAKDLQELGVNYRRDNSNRISEKSKFPRKHRVFGDFLKQHYLQLVSRNGIPVRREAHCIQ